MENSNSNIYKLLINEDFEILKARINEFNPFKVLKIENYEIRHSNFLAWILDPSENHNLDDKVLKKFLLNIVLKAENEDLLGEEIQLLDLNQANFLDAKVYREAYKIDVLIVCELSKFIILIENKIYSNEHSKQLDRYLNKIKSEFKNYKIIPIYLTLEGEDPSNNKYFTASYHDFLTVLEFSIKLYKDRIPLEILNFIEFYLKILKEKIMIDEELKKLCRKIYIENKEAIDLIYTVGNEIDISASIIDFKKQYPEIEETWSNNKVFWFLLPQFKKAEKMNSDWGGGYPIAYWFSEYYGKLKIILEIGPFNDSNQRIKFLEKLEEKEIPISKRAKEPGRQYTRIYTDTKTISDWTDKQEITDAMIALFQKKKLRDIEKKLLSAIDDFSWT